jgi:hypothetical protein
MILAKPVVANKYWILKEDDRKIGAVEAVKDGFSVKMYDNFQEFKTIKIIKNKTRIIFEEPPVKPADNNHVVNGFATDSLPYNSIFDVQRRLPIYTKKRKSKSWFAAGWYRVELDGVWQTMFCPKLILLQRYQYCGPVHGPNQFTYE